MTSSTVYMYICSNINVLKAQSDKKFPPFSPWLCYFNLIYDFAKGAKRHIENDLDSDYVGS